MTDVLPPLCLGIDPGAHGAYALLYQTPDGRPQVFEALRVDQATPWQIASWLSWSASRIRLVVREDVRGWPRDGVSNAFAFGRTVGVIDAVLSMVHLEEPRVPVVMVDPKTWQRAMYDGETTKGDKARTTLDAKAYAGRSGSYRHPFDRRVISVSQKDGEAILLGAWGILHCQRWSP